MYTLMYCDALCVYMYTFTYTRLYTLGLEPTKNSHLRGTIQKPFFNTFSRLDHWSLGHWGHIQVIIFTTANQDRPFSSRGPPRKNVQHGLRLPSRGAWCPGQNAWSRTPTRFSSSSPSGDADAVPGRGVTQGRSKVTVISAAAWPCRPPRWHPVIPSPVERNYTGHVGDAESRLLFVTCTA